MDIDLGPGIDGTEAARQIREYRELPIVFLSSHTEPEIVERTEKITSYGYVVKSSSITVLDASIKMAFRLFQANRKLTNELFRRRQAEDQIRKLSLGIEQSSASVVITDAKGTIEYVNPRFTEITGYSEGEVLGQNPRILKTDEKTIEEYKELWNTINSGAIWRGEFHDKKKNGELYWESASISPIRNEQGIITHFIAIKDDITERKENLLRLQDSEARFKLLHDASFGGIVIHDQGVVLECNQGLCELSGFSREELVGTDGFKLIAPEYRDLVRENIRSGYEKPYEAVGIRKNGTRYPLGLVAKNVIYQGKKVRVAEFRDITQIKQNEHLIFEKNALLETVLETVPLPIFYKDSYGRYTGFNKAFEDFYGVSKENLMGKTVFDISPPDLAQKYFEMDQELFDRPSTQTYETQVMTPSQGLRDVVFHKASLVNETGEVNGLVGAVIDVTETKSFQRLIEHQLHEKEILVREVYHRIKNNIASIENLLTLQAQAAKNSDVSVALQDALGRVRSMRVLYEKLLVSDALESGSVKNYLASLIPGVLGLFSHAPNLRLLQNLEDIDLPGKTIIVLGIIANELLTNTLKYAFKGRNRGTISVSFRAMNEKLEMVIADDGHGLPEGYDFVSSTGFGHLLVRMLAEQLHGEFRLENDHGTRATLTFLQPI